MVKKKGKSKRTTLKDKYKIQRRVVETNRKRRKVAKRDAKSGVVRPNQQKRDPGIPNAWPFKQELLKDIQRARERQQQQLEDKKDKRKEELKALRAHQEQGGTCRTVAELMARANEDQQAFEAKQINNGMEAAADQTASGKRSDGTVAAGQQSRRAYLRELKKVIDNSDVLLPVIRLDPEFTRVWRR
jgi:nuclear GTP-binding protein